MQARIELEIYGLADSLFEDLRARSAVPVCAVCVGCGATGKFGPSPAYVRCLASSMHATCHACRLKPILESTSRTPERQPSSRIAGVG
jgi:hypothetical protein